MVIYCKSKTISSFSGYNPFLFRIVVAEIKEGAYNVEKLTGVLLIEFLMNTDLCHF